MRMNEYLTEVEKKQLEELMKKAVERSGKNMEGDDGLRSFMLWKFEFDDAVNKDEEKIQKIVGFEKELKCLMEHICRFCQKNGYCESCRRCRMYDEDDEVLPFDILEECEECKDEKEEIQKHRQSGRMSMLFELVDQGKITLDEAAQVAKMTWGEAEDMLRGWQIARDM